MGGNWRGPGLLELAEKIAQFCMSPSFDKRQRFMSFCSIPNVPSEHFISRNNESLFDSISRNTFIKKFRWKLYCTRIVPHVKNP